MSLASDLLAAVQGVAPSAVGVTIGRRDDRSTWRVQLADGASADDVAAAQAAAQATIDGFQETTERRLVAKSLIISRLTDAQLDAALAAMTTRQKERWRAPDHPAIYADDAEAVALVRAVGADPAVILAP